MVRCGSLAVRGKFRDAGGGPWLGMVLRSRPAGGSSGPRGEPRDAGKGLRKTGYKKMPR